MVSVTICDTGDNIDIIYGQPLNVHATTFLHLDYSFK